MKYYCRNCGSEMELTETDQISLPVKDLTKFLNFLNNLLEILPDEKIVDIANSENFEVCKQLFDKLHLQLLSKKSL